MIPHDRKALAPFLAILAMACAFWICRSGAASAQTTVPSTDLRPNIILILADDLGYGDLSAYGATDIDTPKIDSIAKEGIRFTDYYSAANTCSPSRAALLTGRYPARTGVNAVLSYDTPEGLPPDEITVAEMLRKAGYVTGMIGKWHLGMSEAYMPWHQGFDEFFGVNTSNDDYNFFLYESKGSDYHRFPGKVDQTRLTQQYNAHALRFIEEHANQSKPFFLYFAHSEPHVPLHPASRFVGKSRRGIFGDVVMEVDDSVGKVLGKLKELHIDGDTLVIFTSDNGAWKTMRDWGGSNGILREGKMTTFDGGHRVPALARWPGHIPAGRVDRDMATMMDWFPTFAHLLGLPLPAHRAIDGKDLSGVITGSGKRAITPYFYFALRTPIGDQHYKLGGVRDGRWKYELPQRGYYPKLLEPLMKVGQYHHGALLFDLETDPGETTNVIDAHPEVVQHMRQLLTAFKANNVMREPVAFTAQAKDDAGWEKMWHGFEEAAAVSLLFLAAVIYGLVKLIRLAIHRSADPIGSARDGT